MDLRGLFESDVPRAELPWYLAPLPEPIENFALNLVWPIVAVNLLGTAFGFYYYGFQLSRTPVGMWPFVPDSPVATLFVALALASWKLGRPQQWLIALAFFGNIILGGWTVWVHLAFYEQFGYLGEPMRQFLIWSHAAMVLQSFVLHRIGTFDLRAVGVATLWYAIDTTVDYFVPVLGELHHTFLPTPREQPMFLGADALGVAAAGAVLLLILSLYLALATRIEMGESRRA